MGRPGKRTIASTLQTSKYADSVPQQPQGEEIPDPTKPQQAGIANSIETPSSGKYWDTSKRPMQPEQNVLSDDYEPVVDEEPDFIGETIKNNVVSSLFSTLMA